MLAQIEGSRAVARAVACCRPEVVCAYPISPQTHIIEAVGALVKWGDLAPCEFVNVESEFAAMSVSVGASAPGARAYTAIASQGLLYMMEAVHNAAGLGLPIVMTFANRAIGAPINIWNDHRDAMAAEGSGWIQPFAVTNQEAVDLHVLAFRPAEELSVPVMVCMDGFVLTHAVERIDLPAGDSTRVLDALALLRRVAEDDPPRHGRHVVVYGGGDTAVGAARTACRLGATDAVIVYRRNRARMPAQSEELDAALAEGVTVRWLRTVDSLRGGHLRVERRALDGEGMPRPTGEFAELGADPLALALDQDTDLSLLDGDPVLSTGDGVLPAGKAMMTAEPGVVAGGDATPSPRTATVAVGHGARAARGIDDYLSGCPTEAPEVAEPATFDRLNSWSVADAPRTRRTELEAVRRQRSFDEVVVGLTEQNALFEARRCLSCGSCFSCDNCFAVCPDNAVLRFDGPDPYAFDYDHRKGCGLCARERPCGAIDMVPERI